MASSTGTITFFHCPFLLARRATGQLAPRQVPLFHIAWAGFQLFCTYLFWTLHWLTELAFPVCAALFSGRSVLEDLRLPVAGSHFLTLRVRRSPYLCRLGLVPFSLSRRRSLPVWAPRTVVAVDKSHRPAADSEATSRAVIASI